MWLFFFSNDLGSLLGQKLAVLVFSRNAAVGRSKAVVSRVNMYVLEHIVIIRVLSLIKVKIKKLLLLNQNINKLKDTLGVGPSVEQSWPGALAS